MVLSTTFFFHRNPISAGLRVVMEIVMCCTISAIRSVLCLYIMQTSPCHLHPLTPHFYIVKLGFTGVYIFFLFLFRKIDRWYSLEPPEAIYVLSENNTNITIINSKIIIFTAVENLSMIHRHVCVMSYFQIVLLILYHDSTNAQITTMTLVKTLLLPRKMTTL